MHRSAHLDLGAVDHAFSARSPFRSAFRRSVRGGGSGCRYDHDRSGTFEPGRRLISETADMNRDETIRMELGLYTFAETTPDESGHGITPPPKRMRELVEEA